MFPREDVHTWVTDVGASVEFLGWSRTYHRLESLYTFLTLDMKVENLLDLPFEGLAQTF